MIIGKTNLGIVELVNKDIKQLDNVFIDSDGSSCVANTKCSIIVSPVLAAIKKAVPLVETPGTPQLVLPSDSVKEVLKNMPKDTTFKGLLEHVDVHPFKDNINFTLTDGKRRRQIAGKRGGTDFLKVKNFLAETYRKRTGNRFIVNRRNLIKLLSSIDKVCPDSSGYSPIYIETTSDDNLVFRSENMATGQITVGVLGSVSSDVGGWLNDSDWEKSFTVAKKKGIGKVKKVAPVKKPCKRRKDGR